MESRSRINRISAHLKTHPTAAGQTSVFGSVGTRGGDDVVVVKALRTAIGKAKRGSFKNTTPDDLLKVVLEAATEGVDKASLGEVTVGNVQLGGAYSGPARMAQLRAGFPETVPLHSVNRQCSSGLQAVASVASGIASGYIDAGIGAGVESMSFGGGVAGGGKGAPPPLNINGIVEHPLAATSLTPMGITSENVAERYGVTRRDQDAMAEDSHRKALQAQASGRFKDEIVPMTVTLEDKDGNKKTVVVDKDDGPRAGSTLEKLMKLKPAFKKGGSTTAGNASQVSDGAAAVLLMKRSKAAALGLPILGSFRGFKVVGVKPDVMGIGPAEAIPALLSDVNVNIDDVDLFEINEAFASQAVYCVRKLGIPMAKVNPLGGAIALGHPLGMTGARQVATLMHELRRTDKKLGIVSMCIGTGMGAAALFEAEN